MRLSKLSSTKLIAVGAFLIFGGCLSISLGIPSATPVNGSFPYGHIGYGIWGGLIYVIVGLLNIVVAFKKSPELVMWCLILNVVCVVLGVLQLALGITAANQDYNAKWLRETNSNTTYYKDAKQYYEKYFPMTIMIAESRNLVPELHNGVVAVDALLACAGFIVAIAAAIAASSAAAAVCCPELMTDLDSITIISAVGTDAKQKPACHVTHENVGFESQA